LFRQFLFDYLDPSGAHYSKRNNYYDQQPGSHHRYSNVGAALAGYMVEVLQVIVHFSDPAFNNN
jgi:CubicO group peptidase (beta-lactamase class C family)